MSILDVKDRIPTEILSNGAVRYGVYDENNNLIRYEYMKREDEPIEQGDAINKAFFDNFQSKAIGVHPLEDYEDIADGGEAFFDSVGENITLDSQPGSYNSSTVLKNGNIFIFWGNGTTTSYCSVLKQKGDIILPAKTLALGYVTYSSCATLENGNVFISYVSGGAVAFAIVDQEGNIVKGRTVIAARDGVNTTVLDSTVMKNGNVFIAYNQPNANKYCAFVIYDQAGNLVKSETVHRAAQLTSVSVNTTQDGNAILGYTTGGGTGYFAIYDQAGNLVKSDVTIASASSGVTWLSGCVIQNGNFVFAWYNSNNSLGQLAIFDGTTYNSVYTATYATNPLYTGTRVVPTNDGGFLLVFNQEVSSVKASWCQKYNSNFAYETGTVLFEGYLDFFDMIALPNGTAMATFRNRVNDVNLPTAKIIGRFEGYYRRNFLLPEVGVPLQYQKLNVLFKKQENDAPIVSYSINDIILQSNLPGNGYYSLAYNGESWDVVNTKVVTGSFAVTSRVTTEIDLYGAKTVLFDASKYASANYSLGTKIIDRGQQAYAIYQSGSNYVTGMLSNDGQKFTVNYQLADVGVINYIAIY